MMGVIYFGIVAVMAFSSLLVVTLMLRADCMNDERGCDDNGE